MHSLAELHAAWEGHPFAEIAENSDLQAFFAPLLEAASDDEDDNTIGFMENELGLTVDEFLEIFPGQIAVAMFNLPELAMKVEDRPSVGFMAEFSGDGERIKEMMKMLHEKSLEVRKEGNSDFESKLIEETFMGEALYFAEIFDGEETYIENGYALIDGIFVFADPESRLRSLVETIKDGPESPLSENAAYIRSRERGGRGDASVYVNLEEIMPPLNKALLEFSMEGGAAMFGVSANSLDAALSLESMQALFVDVDLIEEGLSTHSGIIYREKAGLMGLFTYNNGPLPEARYIPESIFSTSITTFDVSAMVAKLEQFLGAASPTLPPLIEMQMQNVRTQTGIDLRESILQNFGGGLVTLATLPAAQRDDPTFIQPEQVILLELRNPEALSGAVEALIDMAPGVRELIEVQEFAGERIHTIKTIEDPMMPEASGEDVSYVITRTHFIINIGSIGLLQEVLSRIESGDDGFWQSAEAERLFEDMAMDGAVSRSYLDLEQMAVPMMQTFAETMALSGNGFDPDGVPAGLSMPFHGLAEVNQEDDGLFSRSYIIKKESSK
jgi:hypothetical protein